MEGFLPEFYTCGRFMKYSMSGTNLSLQTGLRSTKCSVVEKSQVSDYALEKCDGRFNTKLNYKAF